MVTAEGRWQPGVRVGQAGELCRTALHRFGWGFDNKCRTNDSNQENSLDFGLAMSEMSFQRVSGNGYGIKVELNGEDA